MDETVENPKVFREVFAKRCDTNFNYEKETIIEVDILTEARKESI